MQKAYRDPEYSVWVVAKCKKCGYVGDQNVTLSVSRGEDKLKLTQFCPCCLKKPIIKSVPLIELTDKERWESNIAYNNAYTEREATKAADQT